MRALLGQAEDNLWSRKFSGINSYLSVDICRVLARFCWRQHTGIISLTLHNQYEAFLSVQRNCYITKPCICLHVLFDLKNPKGKHSYPLCQLSMHYLLALNSLFLACSAKLYPSPLTMFPVPEGKTVSFNSRGFWRSTVGRRGSLEGLPGRLLNAQGFSRPTMQELPSAQLDRCLAVGSTPERVAYTRTPWAIL